MSNLDDPGLLQLDASGMFKWIGELGTEMIHAWDAADELELPPGAAEATSVIIAGMGGSATAGDYFATLTAIDNTGQVYTVQTLVTVTDVQLPTITIEPQAGGSSETIDFSTSIDGNIVGWAWDFGDGTTGSGSSVTHSYSAPGDYYTSLTASL